MFPSAAAHPLTQRVLYTSFLAEQILSPLLLPRPAPTSVHNALSLSLSLSHSPPRTTLLVFYPLGNISG